MSLDTANEAAEAPADAADSKKARVWRAELNDNYCKLRRLDHPPVGYDGNGKLTFAKDAISNPESYILWDTSRDAPPGFGLKVAGKKTYILRRKVMGKSMLAKVPAATRWLMVSSRAWVAFEVKTSDSISV